ncbi:MAG: hypothetical protein JSW08_00080 [archaeon]|nr:MAG: hypothetical protein JSW08_00080 [archaeon]
MFGMVTYQFLKPDIAIQRDASHMNCSAPDTSGDKVICLILDSVVILVVITIISAAGGMITNRALK